MAAKRRLTDYDSLPDEMWTAIFTSGINKSDFDIRDISSISISCKRFNELSEQDALWSALLTLDFPPNADDKEGDDHSNSDYQPSSKKDLYMNALKRRLKDELECHQVGIVKIEQELMYYEEDCVEQEADRCATIEEFLIRYQMVMRNNIPDNQIEAFDAVYRLRHALSEQLKVVFGEPLEMINTREPGAAFDYQPPPLSLYSLNVDCSRTNPSYFEYITNSLRRRVKKQLSRQKSILSAMKQVHNRINFLLHRQQEHCQKVEKIKSRLSVLASSLKTDDDDDDDDDDEVEEVKKDDANDEANDRDQDVQVP